MTDFTMSQFASKDDMLRAVMQENEQLKARLVTEAARTAEQKLRADQMTERLDMANKLGNEAREQLAAAQQGVQSIAKELAEMLERSITGLGHYRNTENWSEADEEHINECNALLERFACFDDADATHPTPQGQAQAQDMYYLQDARWSAMVGNCPSFWREGGNGYTTNIDEAGRFTFEEAMAQHRCRETDLPWLCAEVDKLRRPTIDYQYLPRSWDEQRAALAAQAKQGGTANG